MTYMDEAARRMDRRQADAPTVRVREGGSFRGPVVVETADPSRPSLNELATLATNQRGTVRASARAGSKAHLAELTEPQLRVLRAADNPSGAVSQNGSTGVTRPLIRALVAKGYGTAMYDMRRRHLIVGFHINDRGRTAARTKYGTPEWAIDGCPHGARKWADDAHVHPFTD